MVYVYIAKINQELDQNDYASFMKYIDPDKYDKMHKYRFKKDFILALYGEVLLKYGLAKQWNIPYQFLRIRHNKQGKPYLEDYEGIYFNISHSGEYATCVISESEVGIDIQRMDSDDLEELAKLGKRFFSREEYEQLKHSDQKKNLFYSMWSLKESYIKYKGTGLSMPLDSFSFTISNENRVQYKNKNELQEMKMLNFRLLNVEDSYKLAICMPHAVGREQIEILNEEQIRLILKTNSEN